MFDRIVGQGPKRKERIEELFGLHPAEIRALLELGWDTRIHSANISVGKPDRRSEISQLPKYFIDALFNNPITGNFPSENRERFDCDTRWDHLIYAYLIENTCTYKVFGKVLFEYAHGEKLSVPTLEAQSWLRNTEELFYSNPAPSSIYNVQSSIRPSMEATRRNAYFRMFGMDLNHGNENNTAFDFIKAPSANRDFVSTFGDFLREVWVGIENTKNSSGVNRTDDAAIASLARQLHDMLNDRRLNGNLSREEFFAVSMMSWFHLTLEFDSSIVKSLRAEGQREDQRLYRIAESVNVPAHAKSYDFFRLARPLSRILTMIEMGSFNDEPGVKALFRVDGTTNPIESDMRTIITHWGFATGRDMKVRRGVNIAIANNDYRGYTPDQVPSSNGISKEVFN